MITGVFVFMKSSKNISLEDIEGEVWRNIEGYENIYDVSNFGRVKSLDRSISYKAGYIKRINPKILKLNHRVYLMVELCKGNIRKTYTVHRLVAKAFLLKKEKLPIINHIDGNKYNANVSNLEWFTYSQNEFHKYHTLKKLDATCNLPHMKIINKAIRVDNKWMVGPMIQNVYNDLIEGKTIMQDKKRYGVLHAKIFRLRSQFGINIYSWKTANTYYAYSLTPSKCY